MAFDSRRVVPEEMRRERLSMVRPVTKKKTRQGSAGDANQREATREIRGKKVVSLVIVPIDTATNNIKESPIDFPSHTLRPRRLDRITGL